MAESKKTNAKRMGVKAVLAHGTDKLTMTTFGKGNRAEIAFSEGNKGHGLQTPFQFGKKRFSVQDIDKEIYSRGESDGKLLETRMPNPAGKVGEDYLKFKDTLEKQFFGKTFPNDNIRIQIIYLILDIQKILGMTVFDILYTLGNLQDQDIDQFGKSLATDTVISKVIKDMRPYFGLFGGVFQIPPKDKPEQGMEHNINILRCISSLRNATAHNQEKEFPWFKVTDYSKIFHGGKGDWKIIESLYRKKIWTINDNFAKNSKVNLDILFALLHASETQKPEITMDYYRFSILKDGKNLGINLVKVRENIIDSFFRQLRNKRYDSQRQKINVIADFLVFRALNSDRKFVEKMVSHLRLTEDEKAKEKLYRDFARDVWGRVKTNLEPYFKDPITYIKKYKPDNKDKKDRVPEKWFANCKLPETGGNSFVKVLSFLCNFLEGKEINEFLTSYIHKFECIQSFINTIHELNEEIRFTDRYALFNTTDFAKKVATELRVLASIGKMKPDLEEAKRLLYKYAIQTLGFPVGMEKYVSDEWLEENVLLNAEDRKNKAKTAKVNPFRNFIAGNVIESRRFMYLVRYSKPSTVRALMQNQKIVNYVLHRLPPDQVKSYAQIFQEEFNETDVDYLTKKLSQFSFETLIDEKNWIIKNSKKNNSGLSFPEKKEVSIKIEQLKAITGLYLSVAYIAIKNIVKANARYYIAFSIFERDLSLMEMKDAAHFQKKNELGYTNYFALTQYYIDRDEEKNYKGDFNDIAALHAHIRNTKRHFTKQWRIWLNEKIMEAKAVQNTGLLLSEARNQVEHLNVLRRMYDFISDFRTGEQPMRSYFELFHYLIQRLLLENPELNLAPYRDWILRFGRPDRDLIQYTFVSLAYNLARYRNLTKEHHFDEIVLERLREEKQENPEK